MKSTISKALRNQIAERDGYACILCENPYSDVHHVIARSKGGRNVPHNLVCLCRFCHMMAHGEIPGFKASVGVNAVRYLINYCDSIGDMDAVEEICDHFAEWYEQGKL